jgi:mRNA deadenylase 3'-5' endonuclease subunit Ccr4
MNLNILSWNILSNKWIRPEFYNNINIKALNDQNRYIKIIDYITNINYDIILLQECDNEFINLLHMRLNMYHIYISKPIIWDNSIYRATYNITLLKKINIVFRNINVHYSQYSIILYNNYINIINVHLNDISLFKRKKEINDISRFLINKYTIIGGDFNDDNHIYSTLINNYNFIKYNNKPTYYIDQPLCIDNILINNKNKHTLMVPNIITNENNMFKKYHSDHLPLSLNIKF